MLKCAIIGLGGLGKKHLGNVLAMQDRLELVALCDVEENRLTEGVLTNLGEIKTSVDLTKYRFYTKAEEMLEKEELDFVITALPTYLHEKYAVMALDHGVHVFSEKPMARTEEQCRNMIEAAGRNQKKLMIGQCLRYKDGYIALKEYLENGKLGKFIRAAFHRYSLLPVWGWDGWYLDFDRSGCAAMDLHVHDVDLINWMFGRPVAVSSVATHTRTRFDSISTRYFFENGSFVTADCDWSLGESFGFRRGYTAVFEKATLELKDSGELIVAPIEGEAYQVALSGLDPYVEELQDFVDCIEQNREVTVITPESTKQSVEIVLAEMRSAEAGEVVRL